MVWTKTYKFIRSRVYIKWEGGEGYEIWGNIRGHNTGFTMIVYARSLSYSNIGVVTIHWKNHNTELLLSSASTAMTSILTLCLWWCVKKLAVCTILWFLSILLSLIFCIKSWAFFSLLITGIWIQQNVNIRRNDESVIQLSLLQDIQHGQCI